MPSFPTGQRLFIRQQGKVAGPYAAEMLESLRQLGMLLPSHEVSADGESWRTASEAGLFPSTAPPPPPPPPLSSLREEREPWPDEVEAPEAEPRRRRRAAPQPTALPAWLMLTIAGVLGVATSLAAYFFVVRPLFRADDDPAAHAPSPRPREGPRPDNSRGETNKPPVRKSNKKSLGWLLLTVEPRPPRIGEEIRVTVRASVAGEKVPYEKLTVTLAGEKVEPELDVRKGEFRFKAPTFAIDVCHLAVVLPADERYESATGATTFAVRRRARGPFELTAGTARLASGKPAVVTVKWGEKAAAPVRDRAPTFHVDGTEVNEKAVRSLGEGRYELSGEWAAGEHKFEARFPGDDEHEEARSSRPLLLTVAAKPATVKLILPEGRYLPSQRARLSVDVRGEQGAVGGEVELFRVGGDRALARARLKDGAAALEVKELTGKSIDLEARYLGDGKLNDPVQAAEKSIPIVAQVAYAGLAVPERGPNENEDWAWSKKLATPLSLRSYGIDAGAAHLRLLFPANTPGAEDSKHTFLPAAPSKATVAPSEKGIVRLPVSWQSSYVPFKRIREEKEKIDAWVAFCLVADKGFYHLMNSRAITEELTYEKKLYTGEAFLRKEKLAAIRRRLEALRQLRAHGVIAVYDKEPRDARAVPVLLIRLDGAEK